MNKILIGIDPDLRVLSAAVLSDEFKLLGVFARKNYGGEGDHAVAAAAISAGWLARDVMEATSAPLTTSATLIVESQNMMHTKGARDRGRKINYESIRVLSQVTGCLLGAFSTICDSINLVQPSQWKKGTPKHIHHGRIYTALGIHYTLMGGNEQYGVPVNHKELSKFSHDRINPGDWKDVSDSVGLALWGAKNYG